MLKHIKTFLIWLLPILRTAVVQVAADTLTTMAYLPAERERRRHYGHVRYDRMSSPRPRTMQDVERIDNLAAEKAGLVDSDTPEEFHDVLMVAFDLRGKTAHEVHTWLMAKMPRPNNGGYIVPEVVLDDWWIADDGAKDDRDSAVFVSKGNQIAARKLLREHGLVE